MHGETDDVLKQRLLKDKISTLIFMACCSKVFICMFLMLHLHLLVPKLEARPLELHRQQKNITEPFLNLFAKRKLIAYGETLAAEPMRISPGGPDPKHH